MGFFSDSVTSSCREGSDEFYFTPYLIDFLIQFESIACQCQPLLLTIEKHFRAKQVAASSINSPPLFGAQGSEAYTIVITLDFSHQPPLHMSGK